ncbi:FecR domain-containing protein [Sphingomonas sp. 28-63-12]|uniref:FecR family protein n=1 Tax=Sphingomonas sp. 28-63-12 TaxID=1970434 RepID=UPI0035A86D2B
MLIVDGTPAALFIDVMTGYAVAVKLAGLAFAGLLVGADVAGPLAGTAVVVRNVATAATPPAAAVRLRVDGAVHRHDVIATAAKSAVGVKLADGTLFSIGANARVSIDDFVFDPDRNASRMTINVIKGAFRFISGKPTHAYPGQAAIVTPAGTIGIRGTVVTGVVGPEALSFYRSADPVLGQQDQPDDSATLIILSDTGGEGGGIDFTANGTVTPLRSVGQALYFPRRGSPPRPPFMVGPALRGQIERGAEPRNFSRNQGAPPPVTAPGGQNNRNPPGNNGPGGRNGAPGSGPGGGPAGAPPPQSPRPR